VCAIFIIFKELPREMWSGEFNSMLRKFFETKINAVFYYFNFNMFQVLSPQSQTPLTKFSFAHIADLNIERRKIFHSGTHRNAHIAIVDKEIVKCIGHGMGPSCGVCDGR
jgi:hypothetical protein